MKATNHLQSIFRIFSSQQGEHLEKRSPDLGAVQEESKRISIKLEETLKLAEDSKLIKRYPDTVSRSVNDESTKNSDMVSDRWREDEDDRYDSGNSPNNSCKQSLYCDNNPDEVRGILKLFLADHDAAQHEQYELENNMKIPFAAAHKSKRTKT